MNKELGKITKVELGLGGYQDCQFGLFLTFDFKGAGCTASIVSSWDSATMECSESCQWTEKDRSESHDMLCRKISELLRDAKISHIGDLKGKPIEATFNSKTGGLDKYMLKYII